MSDQPAVSPSSRVEARGEIADLLDRLRAATGPDRALDEALFERDHGRKRYRSTFEQYEPSEELTPYTASLDAALALVERVLPEANTLFIEKEPQTKRHSAYWEVSLQRNNVDSGHWAHNGIAPTAPLAVLIALLTALAADTPTPQHGLEPRESGG